MNLWIRLSFHVWYIFCGHIKNVLNLKKSYDLLHNKVRVVKIFSTALNTTQKVGTMLLPFHVIFFCGQGIIIF